MWEWPASFWVASFGAPADHLLVPEQFAVAGVEKKARQDPPCSSRRGEEQALPHATGDDQPTPGTSTCQAEVFLQAPGQRQTCLAGSPLPSRPSEARPVLRAQGAVSHAITNAATLRIPGCHHVVMSVLIRSFSAAQFTADRSLHGVPPLGRDPVGVQFHRPRVHPKPALPVISQRICRTMLPMKSIAMPLPGWTPLQMPAQDNQTDAASLAEIARPPLPVPGREFAQSEDKASPVANQAGVVGMV